MKKADDYIFDLMDALQSPILTHAQSWADLLPERILNLVPMQRMLYLMQKKEYATEVEAVLFIMTRSMEAPMTSDWADIYTHLGCKVEKENFGRDTFDEIKAPRELTDYQLKYLLNPLLKHIYVKRRDILKKRLKDLPKEKIESEVKTIITSNPAYEQLSLF